MPLRYGRGGDAFLVHGWTVTVLRSTIPGSRSHVWFLVQSGSARAEGDPGP